jgi:hypothetical protein
MVVRRIQPCCCNKEAGSVLSLGPQELALQLEPEEQDEALAQELPA